MSFHTTLRLELSRAQGMLRNGDSDDAYQGTVDAFRAAYSLVRPHTVLEHGRPLPELSRPHTMVYANFHKNAATALRHLDNAMLSVEDLLSGTFSGTEIYNDIAAEILDALEVL